MFLCAHMHICVEARGRRLGVFLNYSPSHSFSFFLWCVCMYVHMCIHVHMHVSTYECEREHRVHMYAEAQGSCQGSSLVTLPPYSSCQGHSVTGNFRLVSCFSRLTHLSLPTWVCAPGPRGGRRDPTLVCTSLLSTRFNYSFRSRAWIKLVSLASFSGDLSTPSEARITGGLLCHLRLAGSWGSAF